jgi:hypothetical protein
LPESGNWGFSGDGGPAAGASLYYPIGVAVDSHGSVYIADTINNRIRKVSGGTITTVAGNGNAAFSGDGGLATSASLQAPSEVAVDSSGNMFIADTSNQRIRKVSGTTITTVAGNGNYGFSGDGGPATSASLFGPARVAVDASGNVYIADTTNERIRKVSGGIITTAAGYGASYAGGFSGDGGPAPNASLNGPSGVVVDSTGNLYIADTSNGRIRKVSGGAIATVAGNGDYRYAGDGGPAASAALNAPAGVAIDAAGNLYIADQSNNRIRKVSGRTITTVAGSGAGGFSGDGGPATSASLNFPTGVAIDAAGNLYIADQSNQRIRKVSGGTITTVAGNGNTGFSGDGGPATSASLAFPIGVAVDAAGILYIADSADSRVRKVSGGTITTVAGNGNGVFSGDGGPATSASVHYPVGVAVDSVGNLYIADVLNQRIRKVSGGTITTVAGNGKQGFSGDGGPATSASFNGPQSVAVDSAGDLYVADQGNNRIRRVSGGTISTVAGYGSVGFNQGGFSGDGGPAANASLNYPAGVGVDLAGNLYIADTDNNRIRQVLAATPSYTVSLATLTFSAASGGSAPASQSINFTPSVFGLAFTASASASWISVAPSSGAMPAVLSVSVDPSSLAAGTYTQSITIAAPNAAPADTSVSVTITVSAAKPPSLGVSTQHIGFTATQGSSATTQSLQILNNGGGSLPFTVTISAGGGSWLSLSAQSGTATQAVPVSLTVTATPGSLTPGTYNGSISITGAGSTLTVPVTLSISPASATILVSQNALTFNAVSEGGAPLPLVFGILNTGTGSMNWTASTTTLSGGNWLQISSTSGTVQRPFLDVSTVTGSVNPAGLATGMYYGQIQIASTGAVNSPQSLTVILNVFSSGTNLGPQVYPNGLIFTGIAGANPSSQNVMVGNTASSSNSYLSSTIGPLSFLPTNAVIQPSEPTTLIVYPDFSSLGAGIARGTITLQFSDGSPSQAINILMSVAPASAGGAGGDVREKLEPRVTSCSSQALQVIFRLPQSSFNFAATVGQSMTLEAQVSDGCGNLIVPGDQQPQVTAFFSTGETQASMTHIGNGVWQTTWRPVNASASASASVQAGILVGANLVLGDAIVHGSVTQPAPATSTPLVTQQGVVHAASDVAGAPIAPGELITVYGANLASGSAGNQGLPLPVSSNGTQVLLGITPLPILYTSAGQMNERASALFSAGEYHLSTVGPKWDDSLCAANPRRSPGPTGHLHHQRTRLQARRNCEERRGDAGATRNAGRYWRGHRNLLHGSWGRHARCDRGLAGAGSHYSESGNCEHRRPGGASAIQRPDARVCGLVPDQCRGAVRHYDRRYGAGDHHHCGANEPGWRNDLGALSAGLCSIDKLIAGSESGRARSGRNRYRPGSWALTGTRSHDCERWSRPTWP